MSRHEIFWLLCWLEPTSWLRGRTGKRRTKSFFISVNGYLSTDFSNSTLKTSTTVLIRLMMSLNVLVSSVVLFSDESWLVNMMYPFPACGKKLANHSTSLFLSWTTLQNEKKKLWIAQVQCAWTRARNTGSNILSRDFSVKKRYKPKKTCFSVWVVLVNYPSLIVSSICSC